MCTSLNYQDATGRSYFGRTLEMTVDLPYQTVYFPAGWSFTSEMEGHPALTYEGKHGFLAVTMPDRVPSTASPIGLPDLKAVEGLNDQGLTFSLLSYPSAGGPQQAVEVTRAVLSASDLGSWALAQFATVAEVKSALAEQPVMLQALAILGGIESPFHYVVHDATGASIVIEFNRGQMSVHDNPVGVMTNGPEFTWHLTNLDNYTFLSNVDQSAATFGGYQAAQPDSGIATAGLPASNTSVGRFVRAVYYAQFAEKVSDPDQAVQTLAHVMNNFDRPRGITIDYPQKGGGQLEVAGLDGGSGEAYATEFTCWTNLSDLDRKLFFLRDYHGMNYTKFDLTKLAGLKQPKVVPLAKLAGIAEATDLLLAA
ncbi:Penicillin acylase precursor [Methyloligella halotolerans]|uniref:Penicillin acylase n=1 Tax=Methyloligella halotolerans TaxID=1177755 RepID=A0A1E2RZA7_9HYPH|nr:linear amide C-N hydrolase [Methyloligella halotolerans]ODA67389.1 Penicillin acylase precursor [Methyloligella halotolerans]